MRREKAHKIKHNIKNKNNLMWNMISVDIQTINWDACVNVINNKGVRRIRKNIYI